MKKKPDKFERMVVDSLLPKYYLTHREAVLLLRKYHQEVVEAVESMTPYHCEARLAGTMTTEPHGLWIKKSMVLAKLKDLAK